MDKQRLVVPALLLTFNPWPRRLLVASEVALGVVLLLGAGVGTFTYDALGPFHPTFAWYAI